MGIGYVIGCFFSLLFWDFNREKIFQKLSRYLCKLVKSEIVVEFFYIAISLLLIVILHNIVGYSEIYNIITGFLVIDLCSNTVAKDKVKVRKYFYNTIHHISISTVCGFIAPFFYIFIFKNNCFGIAYMIIYYSSQYKNFNLLQQINRILIILPCSIMDALLYAIYVFTNKKPYIDFRGDFLENLIINPALNVDIIASHAQYVNYYYFYGDVNVKYIKSYGNYKHNKITNSNINKYLIVSYSICCITLGLYIICLHYI